MAGLSAPGRLRDHSYSERPSISNRRAELNEAAETPGSVTQEALIGMLSVRENAPDSLSSRHPVADNNAKTVFWRVTDISDGRITPAKSDRLGVCTSAH